MPRSCARRRAGAPGSRSRARAARPRGTRGRGFRSASIEASMVLMRSDLTFEIPPGRIALLTSSTGAAATADQSEAGSQPLVRDVAVAVVGVLRGPSGRLVRRRVVEAVAGPPVVPGRRSRTARIRLRGGRGPPPSREGIASGARRSAPSSVARAAPRPRPGAPPAAPPPRGRRIARRRRAPGDDVAGPVVSRARAWTPARRRSRPRSTAPSGRA
jgi:hypothetical protein